MDKLQTLNVLSTESNGELQLAMLQAVASLSNIITLKFENIGDRSAEKLLRLTQLVNPTFKATVNVTLSAQKLCSFPKLKTLKVLDLNIDPNSEWLISSPLESLSFEMCNLSSQVLATIHNLPHLTSLSLLGIDRPKNFTLRYLANLKFFTRFDFKLWYNYPGTADFESHPPLDLLAPLPNLAHLYLENCEITKNEFDFIGQFPQLAELRLFRVEFDEEHLKALRVDKPSLNLVRELSKCPPGGPHLSAHLAKALAF